MFQEHKGYDFEKSELLLYMSTILEESADLIAAKKFLLDHENNIYDKFTFYESTGKRQLLFSIKCENS